MRLVISNPYSKIYCSYSSDLGDPAADAADRANPSADRPDQYRRWFKLIRIKFRHDIRAPSSGHHLKLNWFQFWYNFKFGHDVEVQELLLSSGAKFEADIQAPHRVLPAHLQVRQARVPVCPRLQAAVQAASTQALERLPSQVYSAVSIGTNLWQYTLSIENTGSTTVGTFWFAWVPGEGFLPDLPTVTGSPSGWTAQITDGTPPTNGYSIQWVAATPLAPGQSATGFQFTSATSPTVMAGASAIHSGTPVANSFIYQAAPLADAGASVVATAGTLPTICSSGSGTASSSSSGTTGGSSSGINSTNGTCGSANGTTVSSMPTANLCSAGTPTTVMLDGNTYIWQCQGTNIGQTDACSAAQSSGSSSGACTDPGSTTAGALEATPVAGMVLTFDDEFNTLSASSSGQGTLWETKFSYNSLTQGNSDNYLYLDPAVCGLGLTPYSLNNGILDVHGQLTDPRLTACGITYPLHGRASGYVPVLLAAIRLL